MNNHENMKENKHIKTIIDTSSTNAEAIIARYQKDKNFFKINEK